MTTPSLPRRAALGQLARSVVAGPIAALSLPSNAASPREVVQKYLRAAEQQDVEAVLALFAPSADYEDVTYAFRIKGTAALRSMFVSAFAGMRGATRTVRHLVADGKVVVVEWVATGPQTGDVLGVKPAGRTLTVRAVSIIEVADGLIVRVTDYTDRAGLEAQLR